MNGDTAGRTSSPSATTLDARTAPTSPLRQHARMSGAYVRPTRCFSSPPGRNKYTSRLLYKKPCLLPPRELMATTYYRYILENIAS
jgi:hypothetical protein